MKFDLQLDNKKFEVDDKNLAGQANGNILIRCGDTVILTTCVMNKKDREGLDFFPLTVDYEEKHYAAGKIKGSRFMRRENRPSDEAICNARLVDRAIRPLFNKNIIKEIQVISTIFSWDGENDPDTLAIVSASLALSISDIPWSGPIAAVRVGEKDDKFILNPTYEERENSDLDVVFAGTSKDGKVLINMIEGGGNEVQEDVMIEALKFSEKYLKELIDFQKKIVEKIGKDKIAIPEPEKDADLEKDMKSFLEDKLEKAIFQKDKTKRAEALDVLKEELFLFIEEKYPEQDKKKYINIFFEAEIDRTIHENVLKYDKRADARKLDELRDIKCEVGVLPRTHGSGLFFRGLTKALSILTLGSPDDQQLLDGMEVFGEKRFMHHYNFPPYSVGETKPVRGPGRREIGHGLLAEKALLPLIPDVDQFPYTIRIVSEMLSSNGSTSMASVCGSSLALMDAGVPIKRPAAGIAIGLMQDNNGKDYKVLTDIQGPEDHYGDMDFKVAGTREGITAIQMDVKITGISEEIMKEALNRAKKARLEILDSIEKTISKPKEELSSYAPRILTLQINPEKIGEVIGPGGKVINGIIDETGAKIDIQDSGLIFITAEKKEAAEGAIAKVKDIVREVKAGEIFKGEVKRILDFGAFVEILPGKDGLVHISKLGPGHIKRVEDVVKIGDIVSVKVLSIDKQGRIDLSLIKKEK